jgi:hypothetical protein
MPVRRGAMHSWRRNVWHALMYFRARDRQLRQQAISSIRGVTGLSVESMPEPLIEARITQIELGRLLRGEAR